MQYTQRYVETKLAFASLLFFFFMSLVFSFSRFYVIFLLTFLLPFILHLPSLIFRSSVELFFLEIDYPSRERKSLTKSIVLEIESNSTFVEK